MDPYAERLRSLSIFQKGGKLCAHAKILFPAEWRLKTLFQPTIGYTIWDVLLLGAGGSLLLLYPYFAQEQFGANVPKRIIIASTEAFRDWSLHKPFSTESIQHHFEYIHNPTPADNDKTLASLKPHSLIVNARIRHNAQDLLTDIAYSRRTAWYEINYRGDLLFQAPGRSAGTIQAAPRLEDGWIHFIHGWTQVISKYFKSTSRARFA